jgi:hypothetical protein
MSAAMTPELQPARRNRRRRVRHKVHTPAYASFTGESKGFMLDLNEIVDISEDGVAIQCSSSLEMNRRFDLCLDLAETTGHIYTTGQVMWSDGSGRSGFRFYDLPPTSLFHLREWLFFNAMAGVASAQADESSIPQRPAEPIRPSYTDTLAALGAVQREVDSLGTDLVAALQLIALRAQTLVQASGAAIALAGNEPEVMVCRASAGPDAPPVGARLQVGSGFSGECVRSGRMLRCDDSETNDLVDRDSCRALGIRSILAAPVRVGDKVIGLLEVFSGKPSAFGENESTVLQRLADTVLAAVNRAARIESVARSIAQPVPFTPSPGSVLFASEAKEHKKEKSDDNPSAGNKGTGGIRLPLSNLIILICAAATIALVLGFFLAPSIQGWVQEKLKVRGNLSEQTVLASSHPPAAPNSPLDTSVETSTLVQLRQLAEQGNAAAENTLGLRYALGDEKEGIKPDERESVRWFTRGATHGNLAAQSKLALLYWVGRGVPKDPNQAYFWAVLARSRGAEGSKDLARVLSSSMTRAQSAAIEQQAEMWLQQHQAQAAEKPEAGR